MSDTDGVEEALEMSLRLAVMTAAQVGERRARDREAAERAAQAESAADARELAARLEGERTAARATLAPVERSDWWETASDARIAHLYEGASAWAESDPEVARLKDVMDAQLKDRYGLDTTVQVGALMAGTAGHDRFAVQQDAPLEERLAAAEARVTWLEGGARNSLPRTHPDRNEGTVRAAHDEVRALRAERDALPPQQDPSQKPEQAAAGTEVAEAAAVTVTASRLNAEASAAAAKGQEPATAGADLAAASEALYDSTERRRQFAQTMTDDGIEPAVVEGRILADVSQGTPATEATAASGRRQPRARKSRAGSATTKQHSDRSR
ncbi:MAG: hypothetical protein L0H79_17430 [Intrasporangium sp.]|uniref:hypothetical protein n=1 Tax=Intrasporangium sp. TaxID=1925024 RepID=UPI002647062B|nr:hypothetical protein [Intrasporangium sp.]MDN5797512.1 hypothetical protein [Intrasporangium sp.]